ncbi:DUF4234 domain-containing protein [Nocardioides sp. AX2bis]|uniref:DUF4234 domain-containing protein n=1 Tax=Nocardioides sp. AX2bis TaxID=2653157 RepID=UPI0012F324DE|nr:DUF4234 domain-containing protein [Nocardioides sp. AX2bis]VXC51237.1 conserved membrane hypothetical protein [Nocardioides sp. AX2bis]
MSDQNPTRPQQDIIPTHPTYGAPQGYPQGYQQGAPQGWSPAQSPVPTQGGYPVGYGQPHHVPVGKIRSTGLCILLTVVTFGIYPLVWFYSVHSEMKRHSGQGIDGGIALVLAFFVAIVMPYITSSEVGGLYERRGQRAPVSGATGLWYFPGMFILVGPLVWFIKTNGALNSYWRTQGAV